MHPILIFRHAPHESPGYFATFLEQRGVPYRLIAIDQGEAIPKSLDKTSGLVFMGGAMSVNDPLPWISEELALIQQAIEVNMPVLGHCLGGQLIAKALGGRVGPNAVKEIGWHEVTKLSNVAVTTWLAPLPTKFMVFHWHGETFSLPSGAEPLLSSHFCANQAFVVGNSLALQCHIEMTAEMIKEWTIADANALQIPSASVQTSDEMMADIQSRVAALQGVAKVLYEHWLRAVVADHFDNAYSN